MIRVLVVDDDFMVAKVHAAFVGRVPAFTVVGVAQTDLDRLFGGRPGRSAGGGRDDPVPRGLSPESAELVGRVLRDADGDLSASECAERTGLSRVSARRYLEHFIETGQAEVRLRYGVAGRPQRRYAWRGR